MDNRRDVSVLGTVLLAAARLVLPSRCAGCGAEGDVVCRSCLARLVCIRPPFCERCGAPGAWPVVRCGECAGRRISFASARAAVVYDREAARVVLGWKDGGRRGVAAVAARLIAEVIPRPAATALVYVPADGERRLERGHAPPEALARALATRWELPCVGALTRVGRGKRQAGLSLAGRRRNVRGAYSACKPVSGPVVLVDDVFTTGATTNACAALLRRAGASRVDVVTFARALR